MNGLPYYKAYPRDFIEGTAGWPFDVKGCYRLVLDMIYLQAGELPDDPRYISGLLGCSVRAWNKYRIDLISRGAIRVENGVISNFRADKELETLAKLQERQRENRSRPNKNNDLEKPRSDHLRDYTDTEPDTDKEDKDLLSLAMPIDDPDPVQDAINLFKDAAEKSGWPVPRILSKARRSALSARLKECGGVDGWKIAIEKAQASAHCCGQNSRGWFLNFDFITNQSSFAKLMEGNYDNRSNNVAFKASAGGHGQSGSIAGVVARREAERQNGR